MCNKQFLIATIVDDQVLIDVAKARAFLTENYLVKHHGSNSITKRPVMIPLGLELTKDKLEFVLQKTNEIKQTQELAWLFKG